MTGAGRREREETFRADVARLVQVVRHHLPAARVPPEFTPLIEPVRHLAGLLDAGAPAGHLREAALAVVDVYEWPAPEASGGGEGPVIDPAILAAVERLRAAVDAMDAGNEDAGNEEQEGDWEEASAEGASVRRGETGSGQA